MLKAVKLEVINRPSGSNKIATHVSLKSFHQVSLLLPAQLHTPDLPYVVVVVDDLGYRLFRQEIALQDTQDGKPQRAQLYGTQQGKRTSWQRTQAI
eukprot:1152322-Pelagomonas_calceolata.AAC.4